jgi:hypothetical protein
MAVTLSLFAGAGAQFFDNNGVPLAGGLIYTYAAGTTTPAVTYTSYTGLTLHTNPIVLDSAGRVPSGGEIWLLVGQSYKFIVKTSVNVLVATYDNIPSAPQPPIVNDASSISYEQGNIVSAGAFVVGNTYMIATVGSTNFTAIGALNNVVGTVFIATGAGSGTGNAYSSRTVQNKFQETVSLKDFGAVGDGVTDDSAAWANFLAYLNTSEFEGFIPAGTYYITTAPGIPSNLSTSTTPELNNYGNIVITGAGASVTTLLAKTEIVSPGTTSTSRPILKIVNPASFSLSGVTLDGGFSTSPTLNTSGYANRDAAALLEVRDCENVNLTNIVVKGFFGHRDNSDNNNGNFGRSGPILIADCSNGFVSNLKEEYPTWREGVFFFNCVNFTIDGFKYIGPVDRSGGSLSTPLNIFGPATKGIILTNTNCTGAWSGSVLNMGGAGDFLIDNFFAQGSISTINDTTGDPKTTSGTTTWGKGIDLGAEHQENAFTVHPNLENVVVNNVVLRDMFSYGFRIIKQATHPAKRVTISNIVLNNGFEGISLENNIDVEISNAVARKILRYVSESASNVFAYSFTDITNLRFSGFCDGSETATYTYPNAPAPYTGGGTAFSRFGIRMSRCLNANIKATIIDFRAPHILYDVDVADDNVYDGSFEINSIASTYTSPTDFSQFYIFGRAANRRLKSLQIVNSMFNNLPLTDSQQLLTFSANGTFGAQILPLGNSKTSVAQDELLGKVTFYNGDGSSSQQGVRASIESYAADANGRGAYLSFKTADAANPLAERLKINANGIKNMPLPTYANDAAAGSGGLVQYDLYQTSTGEVRIKL